MTQDTQRPIPGFEMDAIPDSGTPDRLKPDGELVAQRLTEARLALGLSQADVAKKLGSSTVTVYRWEKGTNIPRKRMLTALSQIYGRTVAWFLGQTLVDEGPTWRLPPDPGADPYAHVTVVGIPVVEAEAGGGAPAFDDTPRCWIPFRRDHLASRGLIPRHCRVVKVTGTSMSPTCPDGSLVMVDVSRTELRHDRMHLFSLPGEGLVVRWVSQDQGAWTLTADDPAWEPRTFQETMTVLGQVRWCCTHMD